MRKNVHEKYVLNKKVHKEKGTKKLHKEKCA